MRVHQHRHRRTTTIRSIPTMYPRYDRILAMRAPLQMPDLKVRKGTSFIQSRTRTDPSFPERTSTLVRPDTHSLLRDHPSHRLLNTHDLFRPIQHARGINHRKMRIELGRMS
jgi:hypothetical protein